MRTIARFLGLFVAFLALVSICGCGDSITVVQPSTAAASKSILTFNSSKSQSLKFTLGEKGGIKDLRDGGVEVMPTDVDYIAWVSYRFGDHVTTPFKASFSATHEVIFSGLPNSDQWCQYWVVLKSGKKYRVELSKFEVKELGNLYYWIDPAQSGLEYGEIDLASAQDWMRMKLDTNTMLTALKGQFGCDLIFGTKQPVAFEQGSKVVVELSTGVTFSGNIVKDADGNLSYEVAGIPVALGPYTYPGYVPTPDYVVNDPTVIKDIYILKPDGTKASFCLQYNTSYTESESMYIWYISAYDQNGIGSLSVEQWDGNVITLRYYPQ